MKIFKSTKFTKFAKPVKSARKAEVPAQIMAYVLAVILFGLIMIFGYNVVVSMRASSESVSMVKFKTQIEGDIKKMSQETGRTVRTFEYYSPGNYKEICFIDSEYIGNAPKIATLETYILTHPEAKCSGKDVMIDSVKANAMKNMFFFPGTSNFYVGEIEVDGGCLCIPSKSGKMIVRMRGKGDRAKIEP